MTQIDPRIRVCGVCAGVLDYVDYGLGGSDFRHNAAAVLDGDDDHPPLPVLPGEVWAATFCDLCHAPDPGWLLPANDFRLRGSDTGSVGDWSVCDDCVPLINQGRWADIGRLVAAGFYLRYGEHLDDNAIAVVRRLHRELRRNITGSPRPGTYPSPDDRRPQ